MIDVILFIRNYVLHAAVHCSSVLGLFVFMISMMHMHILVELSYHLKLTAARLKKGTAQCFRLSNSARIFSIRVGTFIAAQVDTDMA